MAVARRSAKAGRRRQCACTARSCAKAEQRLHSHFEAASQCAQMRSSPCIDMLPLMFKLPRLFVTGASGSFCTLSDS